MKKLSGKNILMIVAKYKFRDEEYMDPRNALEEEGATITVASSSLDIAEGMLGLKVKPDVLIEQVNVDRYDGIIFVGGGGSREYFDNPVAHKLAREFYNNGKLTSAICIAPAILANAGLLVGKRATSFPSSESILKAGGAEVTGEDVSAEGIIVTAVGPETAKKFGQKLLEILVAK